MFGFFDRITRAFWSMFDFVTAVKSAKAVKEDPDRSMYSTYFGMHAIFCGISMLVASVFVGLFIFLKLFALKSLDLALGIAIGVGAVILLAHTIKNLALQIYINKSRMTWVSLAAVLACIAGSVAILLIFAFVI